MRQVTIWHNVQVTPDGRPSGMMDGYKTGDAVSPVFTYPADGRDTLTIADSAFMIFNAPSDHLTSDQQRIEARYRANRLRSLSVGDLVSVNGYFWSCDRVGWTQLGFISPNVTVDPYGREVWL